MIVPGMKNGEMRRGPLCEQLVVRLLDQRQAADAGADVDADALGVLRRHLQAAVLPRLDGRPPCRSG